MLFHEGYVEWMRDAITPFCPKNTIGSVDYSTLKDWIIGMNYDHVDLYYHLHVPWFVPELDQFDLLL